MKFFLLLPILFFSGSFAIAHEGHFSLGHREQLGLGLMMLGILLASIYVFLQRVYKTEESDQKATNPSHDPNTNAPSLTELKGRNYV